MHLCYLLTLIAFSYIYLVLESPETPAQETVSPTVNWVTTKTTFHHIGPAQPGLGNTSLEIQVILACVRLTAEAKHPSLLTSLRSSFFALVWERQGM